jgi:raffinose/stachyose/melibiose transport system permease protein
MRVEINRLNRSAQPGGKNLFGIFRKLPLLLVYIVLITWALINFLPVLWVALAGLKKDVEIFTRPFALPENWLFANYLVAFDKAHIGLYMSNTVFFALGTTAITLFLAAMTAFPFARFNFRYKNYLWWFLMAMFLLPDSMRVVPLIIQLIKAGLYGSMPAIIITYATRSIPFAAFFLRAYMESIPKELEEAAIIDGANMWQVFTKIILPLSKSSLATLAIFIFLTAWNELFYVVLMSRDQTTFTIPAGIATLSSRVMSQNSLIAASFTITLLPVMILFIFAQRHVVKGMTAGALKGT